MSFEEDYNQTWALLRDVAEPGDLNVLVDYITDKGEGRTALDSGVKEILVAAKRSGIYPEHVRSKIGDEIREFGGNSFANVFRSLKGDGLIAYKEVATDVAKHLKVSVPGNMTVVEIETAILQAILKQSIDKMSEEERKALLEALNVTDLSTSGPAIAATLLKAGKMGGIQTYKLALIVANAVAKAITGTGLKFATNTMITKGLSVAMGPIGWVVTGIWTAVDLASPAMRVTLPCVVQIAYIRQKAIAALTENRCDKCAQDNALQAKFCGACGNELGT